MIHAVVHNGLNYNVMPDNVFLFSSLLQFPMMNFLCFANILLKKICN